MEPIFLSLFFWAHLLLVSAVSCVFSVSLPLPLFFVVGVRMEFIVFFEVLAGD